MSFNYILLEEKESFWRTFDVCLITTGAHEVTTEVTTVDELQHCFVDDSPGGGTLTSKGPYESCATVRF